MSGQMDKYNESGKATKTTDYVTLRIEDQLFGIPVLQVQDVLGDIKLTRIPLAPKEVAGSLNLRGRIVTAIDVRKRLGLPDRDFKAGEPRMSVVVDYGNQLYSLIIDSVGEVLSLEDAKFERNPATLDKLWLEISKGIYQLEDELLVVIDVAQMLGTVHADDKMSA